MLLSALLGVGAWPRGTTTSFILLMVLKQTHSGFWGFWGCFFFFSPKSSKVIDLLFNLFLLLSWIYKPHQISSNKTPLPALCLFFLYFRSPAWMVISHHDLFSHHIYENRPQMEQSIAVSCSCKNSLGNSAHRVTGWQQQPALPVAHRNLGHWGVPHLLLQPEAFGTGRGSPWEKLCCWQQPLGSAQTDLQEDIISICLKEIKFAACRGLSCQIELAAGLISKAIKLPDKETSQICWELFSITSPTFLPPPPSLQVIFGSEKEKTKTAECSLILGQVC